MSQVKGSDAAVALLTSPLLRKGSFIAFGWACLRSQEMVNLYRLHLYSAEIQSQCDPDHLQMWIWYQSDCNAFCVHLHLALTCVSPYPDIQILRSQNSPGTLVHSFISFQSLFLLLSSLYVYRFMKPQNKRSSSNIFISNSCKHVYFSLQIRTYSCPLMSSHWCYM